VNRPVTVLTAQASVGRTLRRAGYQVIEAVDGVEVLNYIEHQAPDAAVLDMLLPGLSALEICRRLIAAGSATPVIVVGGRGDPAARVEALRAGADDYLVSPVHAGELVARVEALVRRQRRSLARGSTQRPAVSLDPIATLGALFDHATAESEALAVLTVDLAGLADRPAEACARAATRVVRDEDVVARAGDVLLVIVPRLSLAASVPVAEAVRGAVREVAPAPAVGVACYPGRNIESADDLLRFARQALERARAAGRGRICLYQHQGYLLEPT
jgi:PleD family two-component response regulator